MDQSRRSSELPFRAIPAAFAVSPRKGLAGICWWLLGKRVRGRNLILATASYNPSYYKIWINEVESKFKMLLSKDRSLETSPVRLHVLILSTERAAAADTDITQKSIGRAVEFARALCGGNLNASMFNYHTHSGLSQLKFRDSDEDFNNWIIPIADGDVIAPETLAFVFSTISGRDDIRMLFWDEDVFENGRRSAPWLKGNFDDLLFLGRDGLTGASAIRADLMSDLLKKCGDVPATSAGIFQLFVLAVASGVLVAPQHLPLILTHRPLGGPVVATKVRSGIVSAVLQELRQGKASVSTDTPDLVQLDFGVPSPAPSIAIIIPTRDRADLLRTCLQGLSLLEYSGAVNIFVVDNGSEDPEALLYLASLASNGVTVIRAPGPFNFSRLNNLAVRQISADFICLMNNDVKPLDGSWLTAMIALALRPNIGCVGALLLYPNGTVQHAGVELGVGGAAGHAHRFVEVDSRGHAWLHRTTRSVSIVTAACLIVSRKNYLAVDGLDENDFSVAFNDVDFCLKLGQRGLTNVFVAESVLVHSESVSRQSDFLPQNLQRFRSELSALTHKWLTNEANDPYRSPLLSRQSERHVLEI